MVILAFLWIAIVIAELVWGDADWLRTFGTIIWVIFIVEFVLRFSLAPAKVSFLRGNWISVLALMLPAMRIFRAFRLFRVARAARGLRLVRVIGTANRGMNALRKSLGRRGFAYVMLMTLVVILLGGAGMFAMEAEGERGRGFSSYDEAVWWTSMLIMTLGTDYWPQTVEGRMLCLLLAIYGFGVFGYITASLASFFVGQEARSSASDMVSRTDIAALRREVSQLRRELRASRAIQDEQ
jgi:voltage-gated potassium channel